MRLVRERESPGLAGRLRQALRELPQDGVALHRLAAILGPQSFAAILVLLGLVALIPSPGVPVGAVCGAAIAVLGLRLLAGRSDLPDSIGRRQLPGRHVLAFLERAAPWVERLEAVLRPRLVWLVGRPAVRAYAVVLVLQGILIALPIPLGNPLPGAAVALLGIGLAMRDGAAVLGGLLCSLLATAWSGWLVVVAARLYALA